MSAKRPDNWMPFYIGDYLRDTARLTTEQHGAYLLLLFDAWVNGPLPDDDEQLASVAKLPIPIWKKMRPKIEGYFVRDGGRWTQGRLEEERAKAQRLLKQKVDAAHASVEARRQRKGNGLLTVVATNGETE